MARGNFSSAQNKPYATFTRRDGSAMGTGLCNRKTVPPSMWEDKEWEAERRENPARYEELVTKYRK